MLTMKTGPWIVSMQRPAPGGKVRSAHADTETISGTSTLMAFLSIFAESPDLPERLCGACFCSPLCTWMSGKTKRLAITSLRTNVWFSIYGYSFLVQWNKETNQSLPDEALHDPKKIVTVSNHYEVQLVSLQVVQSDVQLSDVAKVAVKSWVLLMIPTTNPYWI